MHAQPLRNQIATARMGIPCCLRGLLHGAAPRGSHLVRSLIDSGESSFSFEHSRSVQVQYDSDCITLFLCDASLFSLSRKGGAGAGGLQGMVKVEKAKGRPSDFSGRMSVYRKSFRFTLLLLRGPIFFHSFYSMPYRIDQIAEILRNICSSSLRGRGDGAQG